MGSTQICVEYMSTISFNFLWIILFALYLHCNLKTVFVCVCVCGTVPCMSRIRAGRYTMFHFIIQRKRKRNNKAAIILTPLATCVLCAGCSTMVISNLNIFIMKLTNYKLITKKNTFSRHGCGVFN